MSGFLRYTKQQATIILQIMKNTSFINTPQIYAIWLRR